MCSGSEMSEVAVVIVEGLGWGSSQELQDAFGGVWFRGTSQTPSNTTRAIHTGAHVARKGSGDVLGRNNIHVVGCTPNNVETHIDAIRDDMPIVLTGTHNEYGSNIDALDVPIAVLNTDYEDKVDKDTNARHVDIAPTTYSFLDDDTPDTVEGVDLLDFDGELAAYVTPRDVDGIIVNDGFLLSNGKSTVNDVEENKLQNMLDKVREEPDQLVYRFQPNEEFMRDMGYL